MSLNHLQLSTCEANITTCKTSSCLQPDHVSKDTVSPLQCQPSYFCFFTGLIFFPPIASLSTNPHISTFENVSVLSLIPHPFATKPPAPPTPPPGLDHFCISLDSLSLLHVISNITSKYHFLQDMPLFKNLNDSLLTLNQIQTLLLGSQGSSYLALPYLPTLFPLPPQTTPSVRPARNPQCQCPNLPVPTLLFPLPIHSPPQGRSSVPLLCGSVNFLSYSTIMFSN